MRALVFDGSLGLSPDYATPQPPPGEVRVRTLLAGICNTDLEIVRGYAGFRGVLGHEFVGIVDRAADETLLGQRVVGEINVDCGTCTECRAGRPRHCLRRTVLGIRRRDGVMADYFCLPARNLHPVPPGVPDEVAIFTEPLAAACRIPDQVHLRPGRRVVVLGDGKLGLLVAQVLALTGCHLLVIGRHPKNLSILSARGIPTTLDRDIPGSQADIPGSQADVVIDCTGNPKGFATALQLVRPEGTLILKSTYPDRVPVDLSHLAVSEIRVVGSRCGPFPAALRLLARGLIDVTSMLEAEYPLQAGPAAIDHAGRRGALKVVVRP